MAFVLPQPLPISHRVAPIKLGIRLCAASDPSAAALPTTSSKPAASSGSSVRAKPWTPFSWREFPIKQQPSYPDESELMHVEERLRRAPPLVFPGEVTRLQSDLACAARGEKFVLQGGDCAESFEDFSSGGVERMFQVLVGGVVVMSYLGGLGIVKIGRIAGQFAKPRSAETELVNGEDIPVFRGDIINSVEKTKEARAPDPQRLVRAYSQSAAALNMLRALAKSGESMDDWMEVLKKVTAEVRGDLIERVDDALAFVKACGVSVGSSGVFREPDFYTSHEALLLPYEAALTRASVSSETGGTNWYDTSAHMLWCGERTRQLDGAHMEFLRGLKNPIGCKVGPTMEPEELLAIIRALNPNNEEGKLMLIVRMGAEKVFRKLPPLLRAVKKGGLHVVWSCDPMHENTIKTATGTKTRPFDLIKAEMDAFFAVHEAEGTVPGGIHLEMTGDDVTECLGGKTACITEKMLEENFKSTCDPRLSSSQAIEMAFAVGDRLRQRRKARRRRARHTLVGF